MRDVWWIEPVRRVALAVFPGLILLCLLLPRLAGRIFWTVSIASLPLFIVIAGYHRWRRICPLAFVAQLPTRFGLAGQRRAGPWLQAHAYHVVFGVFLFSLWLRLVATNGDGYAIAVFLALLCTGAIAVGLIFTGKTWCNFFCPVSFVEKLYTEPRGLRETPNSQCQKCTACRPVCPDINEENSYWKEILLPAKRHVYFSFPGVVFAFYYYYYLQAGTWDYYFGGGWTHEVGLVRTALLPGHDPATAGLFVWPAVPRAVAAAATLLLGAGISYAAFSFLEPRLGVLLARRAARRDAAGLRHLMFTIAAFTAFIIFYSFAGAPTLRLVPGLPHFFQLLVVGTATLFLMRRIGRRHSDFAEETLSRRIIANWQWPDMPPPRDLREAFLIHTIRSRTREDARKEVLELYKSAVRETVNSGVISREEVHRLEPLRSQLRISEADHEHVMAELLEEDRGFVAGPAWHTSPEKQLQLQTYAEALADYFESRHTSGGSIDDRFVRELRAAHAVTAEEHAAVLLRLVQSREGVAAHVADAPAAIEASAAAIERLEGVRSPVARFLSTLLTRRWTRAADRLLQTLGADRERVEAIRQGLLSADPATREAFVSALGSRLSQGTAERLADALRKARNELGEHASLAASLRAHFSSSDPYVRATALYMLEAADEATEADRAALAHDEHPVVRETVAAARATASGQTVVEPSTLEKMISLRSVSIFDALEPEDLAQLARAGTESWFRQGEVLCQEGEIGDEVFVLLAGEVSVLHRDGETDRVVAVEGPGSCIGELAVLDPAPREATVVASTVAVRTFRLSGHSFRDALDASPAVSEGVIRLLARRLRGGMASPAPASTTIFQRR